jgi:hypothetical protein
MTWIVANIKWVMIASGTLTATMIYAAISPDAALRSSFGETVDGALARLIVRNWSVLIGLVGAMLVYGAFNPPVRPLILIVAGLSKGAFIALVLSEGRRYLGHQVGVAVVIDSLMIAMFAWYLLAVPKQSLSK